MKKAFFFEWGDESTRGAGAGAGECHLGCSSQRYITRQSPVDLKERLLKLVNISFFAFATQVSEGLADPRSITIRAPCYGNEDPHKWASRR